VGSGILNSSEVVYPEEVRVAVANDRVRAVALEEADHTEIYSEFQEFRERLDFEPAGFDPNETVRIHSDKIDARLYPVMHRLAKGFAGDWLEVPVDIGRGYMMYLATAVARRWNLERGTDNPDAWTTAAFFSEDGNFSEYVYGADETDSLRCLCLRDLIPISVADVPMRRIIDFSERRRDQRKEFRATLSEFTDELAICESPERTLCLVNDFSRGLLEKSRELRRSMDFCNSDDLSSIFAVGVPASVTTYGTLCAMHGEGSFAAFFASVLLGAVAAYADYTRTKRQNRACHLNSYLLDMRFELAKRRSAPDFQRIMEEFIND
jgi:hypothetical protein